MTLYVALASSKGAPAGRGPSTGLWLQDRSQVTCKGPRGSTHRRQDRGGKGRRDAGRALGLGVGGARRRTGLQALGPFGARKKGVGGLASGLRASCRPHSSPLCSWQSRLRVTLRAAPGAQGSPPAACCPPPPPPPPLSARTAACGLGTRRQPQELPAGGGGTVTAMTALRGPWAPGGSGAGQRGDAGPQLPCPAAASRRGHGAGRSGGRRS